MDISSVSSKSNMVYSPSGDNEIRLLEKQKSLLQDQIQKTKDSKMDPKTKQETIQLLQDQMQQIDMEIQQKRTEKLNRSQSSDNNTASNNNADQKTTGLNTPEGGIDADMSNLIQAAATYSQAQIINQVKGGLHGKANVLKIEIKLDGDRMGGEIKGKSAQLQKTESLERKLDRKFGDALKKANEQTNKAEEGGNKDADKTKDIDQLKDTDAGADTDAESDGSVNGDVKTDSQQQKKDAAAGTYTRVDIKI